MKLGKDMNKQIHIEADSSRAINLIAKGRTGPAHMRFMTARICLLRREMRCKFTTALRAGNRIAHALVERAADSDNPITFNHQTAPNTLKAMVRLEKDGIPNIDTNFDQAAL